MVVLEGKSMLSKAELHSEIKAKLDLPKYYGENLDALRDCLTGWVELPMEVEWRDFDLVEDSLGEYAQKVFQQFEEADGVTVTRVSGITT